jgi:outer membrane receptor for ferrienterochelin and colicins
MRWCWTCASLLAVGGTSLANGQTSSAFGTVTGTVRADGRPLAHAAVDVVGPDSARSRTGANDAGRYSIPIGPGDYSLRFRFPGYAERRIDGVHVTANATTSIDADLELQAVGLDYVVVTAGRRAESARDAVPSVAVVEATAIRERVALTPLDFVLATPGVDVAVQGLQGRQVVARGFNATISSSLLMMTDYRNASIASPRANVSYFLSQTAEDVERVEILRGPSSALYGPNAADGVVHFITRSPFDSPGTSLSLTGGGRSLFEGSGRYAARLGDAFAFKVSGSYFRGNEWPSVPNPLEHIARDPVTERAGGEFRADWRLSPQATTILTVGRADALRVPEYTPIGAYEIRNWRSDFAQLRFNDGKLFAQVYWNGNPGGGTSTALQSGAVTLDHSSILAGQIQHGIDIGTRHTLLYGIDVQHTDPQSLGTIDGRNEQDDASLEAGAFIQETMRLSPRLQLQGAARVDKHSRLNSAVFSPRLGFAYTPSMGHTFRGSFNRAFSTPAPLELFADILAARLDPLPFNLRAVGVPRDGLRFARDCNGLCATSPFAPGQRLPLDATLLWPAVVQIMRVAGVDLSGIPAPRGSDVTTSLRALDLASGSFRAFAGPVNDVSPLQPTITSSFEGEYRGLVGQRTLFDISAYTTRRQNFIAPLAVVTPNAFLNTASLASYLGRYMPAAQASALAAGIGGVDGDAKQPGIPLATVGPTGLLGGSDILLTYQNVGDVRLWGADVSGEFAASDRVTLTGGYSWVNRNFFAATRAGDIDLSTNAPRQKALAGIRYHQLENDASAEIRGRYVGGFHMVDGVRIGDVKPFAVVDADVGMALPHAQGARITVTVQNAFDNRHAEFFGHPVLGRLLLTRLQYRF